ncbi:hypothetical protein LPJ63_004342 [Coemansia sp. RSA 2711]|nr:hypothetical protein LPJ63_004342 [Coemansia sp. RSA 2711]
MAPSEKSQGKAAALRPKFSVFHFPKTTLDTLNLPRRLNRLSKAGSVRPAATAGAAHYSTPHGVDEQLPRAFAAARIAQATCHTCGGIKFNDAQEQREHFRTAVHQQNAQRKTEWRQRNDHVEAEGEYPWKPVRELEPDAKPAEESEEESGSESEPDEGQTPYLWFTDSAEPSGRVAAYGVHRRVLVAKGTHGIHVDPAQVRAELRSLQLPEAPAKTLAELKAAKRSNTDEIPAVDAQSSVWTLLSSNGGFFAAAVFDNRTGAVLAHKTIQRYTTRRKQGGLQSRQDGASGRAAISAGAQIRRYNERKLQEEIHEQLARWRPLLERSARVFVRVAQTSRRGFFGDACGLRWGDDRVRAVPVAMGRPSLRELQRVYTAMTRVRIAHFDIPEMSEIVAAPEPESVDSSDSQLSEHTLEPEPHPELIAFVHDVARRVLDERETDAAIVAHVCEHLSTLLDAFSDPAVGLRYLDGCPGVQAQRTPTLLHLAAAQGRRELIGFLLDNGEDPTITSGHAPLYAGGMTAYQVSRDRATRDAFRVYRFEHEGEADGIDWERARVPEPLSPEQQRENEAKQRDKKRRDRERRKQQQQKKKEKERSKAAESSGGSGDEEEAMLDRIIAEKGQQTLRGRVKQMTSDEIRRRMRAVAAEARDAKPRLTPEQQRAAERELRFKAAERRRLQQQQHAGVPRPTADTCSHCGRTLHGIEPFEQYDWKCCSIQCLHAQQELYGVNI